MSRFDPPPRDPGTNDEGKTVPVTTSQELFWTGHRLSPGSAHYNMAFRIDFDDALDPERFRAAVDAVVEANDALRTVFRSEGDAVVGQVLEQGGHVHQFVDLAGADDPEARARDWIERRVRRPFDLALTTFDSALLRLGDRRWIWFFNQHHVATDAWSASLVYRGVAEHYVNLASGQTGAPGVPPSYVDHVDEERREHGTRRHEAAVAWWRERLRRSGERLSLYGQPASSFADRSRRITVPLGADRMRRLERLAAQDGVRLLGSDLTRFTLFATAFVAFLARVSGARNVTFGATTHNRRTATDRRTVGLFVELFPLAAQLQDGETFRSLFRSLAQESSGLLLHGRPGTSSPETARLFNVILNYLHMDFGPFGELQTRVRWLDAGAVDPGHALRLNVHDFTGSGELELGVDVNTELFGPELAERIPRHFLRLFDAMLDDFDAVVDRVPFAGEDDASMLDRAGPVAPVPDRKPNVVSLFDHQADAHPDAVALRCGGESVSYAALRARSRAMAQTLRRNGIGAGDIVGICARRSPELVIAVLGVLRTGAAFTPLEPGLPPRRLRLILEDTGARVVVADERGSDAVAGGEIGTVLGVPGEKEDGETGDAADLPPDAAAYVFYTSGSTGRPKGVVVEHGGLVDYILWARETLCGDGAVSFPLFSAFGFDLTVDSLFVPLVAGDCLHVYPEPASGPDLSVVQVFEDDAVDVVKLTPSHLSLVVDRAATTRRIRALLFSGETLRRDLAGRAQEALGPHVSLINEYGPTEAIVGCTHHRFEPDRDRWPSVPIGLPAEGAAIYLLDEGLNPVPVHVEGEIYIGGDRLARGYLGREDLTADRFLPDPFRPGGRMYRTGDRARWDGERLHFLGRTDGQVKIRGTRIELGEVECAVTACEGITGCVVDLTRPAPADGQSTSSDPRGSGDDRRLVAWYTSDRDVSPDTIRNRLAEMLPEPMIPSFFVSLDEIPMTSNGKIDRSALPDPRVERDEGSAGFRPPETETERILAGLWCDALGLSAVGLDDNFFHLGGNSIAVIQVVDRARERGLDVHVPDVFEQPSLAALCRHVARRQVRVEPDPPAGAGERFGLSGLDQEGLERVARLLGGDAGEDDAP